MKYVMKENFNIRIINETALREVVPSKILIGKGFREEFNNEALRSLMEICERVKSNGREYFIPSDFISKVDDSISLSNKSSLRVTFKSETLTYKIPTSSIYNKNERKIVYYKKDNGKLGVKDITIISDDGEFLLVSGNIQEDLKVVTTPIFIK